MKRLTLLLTLSAITACNLLHAQDTLPKFTLKNVGNNRIVVGWTNNFTVVKQISIQRSFDSLTGYKSILTVADPSSPQNGYVDTKATNDHMFYRLYILLDRGVFLFSEAKKPVIDTTQRVVLPTGQLPGVDTTSVTNGSNPKIRPTGFVPSLYVFTHRDGYVKISLPNNEKPKKYSIKFFDSDDNLVFELKEIKERQFKLDKTNFYHAGWFRFELYEDDKLFERHKFYIEKDF